MEHPEIEVRLLTVNEVGHDSGIPELAAITDLPILQDDADTMVWSTWGVTWRDVYVLDGRNEIVAVYNLSEHSLANPDYYEELKSILIAAGAD